MMKEPDSTTFIEDVVSKNIHLHRLSTISEVESSMEIDLSTKKGKDIFLAFYLMTAFYEGSGDIMRRDGLPVIRHLYEATTRPVHRFNETGYRLNDEETVLCLLHDLGEDFGKTFEGAMTLTHILGQSLGDPSLEENLNLLTDRYVLAWEPILKGIMKEKPSYIPLEEVKDPLVLVSIEKAMRRTRMQDFFPRKKAEVVIDKAEKNIDTFVNSMKFLYCRPEYQGGPNMDLGGLDCVDVNEISNLLLRTKNKMRMSKNSYERLNKKIKTSKLEILETIHGMIKEDKLLDIDTSLLAFTESPYLTRVHKTLYNEGYVKDLSEAVKSMAFTNPGGEDLEVTNPYIVKLADSTDNASNLPKDNPTSATRIFRKVKGLCSTSLDTLEIVKKYDYPTVRMNNATTYNMRRIMTKINTYLDQARIDAEVDTMYTRMLERLQILVSKDLF